MYTIREHDDGFKEKSPLHPCSDDLKDRDLLAEGLSACLDMAFTGLAVRIAVQHTPTDEEEADTIVGVVFVPVVATQLQKGETGIFRVSGT